MPLIGFAMRLYDKFDGTFLTMLAMQYFNQGTKVLVGLATQDLFKAYYNLDPGRIQTMLAFTMLPWSLKICYGLISDNLPICGSRRKSYLVTVAILQFLTMTSLGLPWSLSESTAMWMLFLSNFSIAFSDVIVDSLLVIQARKYPENGSEDLNSFAWSWMSIGGLVGSIVAGFLTESYDPRYCFLFSAAIGLLIAFVASRLNVSLETEGLET